MVNIEEIWDFRFNESILGIEIGDVNNNGQKELICFTKSGKICIISKKGKKINELEISEKSSIWQAKICDIDRDNRNELVLGGLDGLLRTFKCTPSYELEPFWAHQFGASISGFLYSDVNFNNNNEIVAYSIDKSIRCLNSLDGSLLWGQLFEDGIGDAILWLDSENPLALEIIACGNDGTIRSFKGDNGELLWFKRYTDKIRCVSTLKSNNNSFIVSGGDDKKIHLIDKITLEELKSFQFNDFVWKCSSIMLEKNQFLLVSTYSFAFLDDSIKIKDVEFSSKLSCLTTELEKKWEIKKINVEVLFPLELFSKCYIIVGTTKGKILIINAGSGEVVTEINKDSCVNDIKYDPESNFLISCHDDGSIFAYFIGNS